MWLTRRAPLQSGASHALGGAALELASLRGAFDNRTLPALEPAERFQEQLRALGSLPGGGWLHIGQSTLLLGHGGMRVLTDPWFYDPAFGTLQHPHAVPHPELI